MKHRKTRGRKITELVFVMLCIFPQAIWANGFLSEKLSSCIASLRNESTKQKIQIPENAILIACNPVGYCQYNSLNVLEVLSKEQGFDMNLATVLVLGYEAGGNEHVVIEYRGLIYDTRLRTDNIVEPKPRSQYFSDEEFVKRSIVRAVPGQEFYETMPLVPGFYYFIDIRFRNSVSPISKTRPLIPLKEYLSQPKPPIAAK